MNNKKLFAGILALSLTCQVIGPLVGENSKDGSSIVYAAKEDAESIYDLYNAFENERVNDIALVNEEDKNIANKYTFIEGDFFKNKKPYSEDIMYINQDKALMDESIKAVKEIRQWAFDNVHTYVYNAKTKSPELMSIGDQLLVKDESGRSKDEIRDEYINSIYWVTDDELFALQDAYKNYLDNNEDKNLSVKDFILAKINNKDHNGQTLIDRYNKFLLDEIKLDHPADEAIETDTDQSGSGIIFISGRPGRFFNEDEIYLLTEEELRFNIGRVSKNNDSYMSISASGFYDSKDGVYNQASNLEGNYKFHAGQAVRYAKDHMKDGNPPTIFDVMKNYSNVLVARYDYYQKKNVWIPYEQTLKSYRMYREDLVTLKQDISLHDEVYNTLREIREKAYKDNLLIFGEKLQDAVEATPTRFVNTRDEYLDINVTDNIKHLQRSYENMLSIRDNNESYLKITGYDTKGKHPDGTDRTSYSYDNLNFYAYKKGGDLDIKDMINDAFYKKDASGLTAYDKLKKGISDESTSAAESLLSPYLGKIYVSDLKAGDESFQQLFLQNYPYTYTMFEHKLNDMTGLVGEFKFTFGTNTDTTENGYKVSDVRFAYSLFDSLVTNSAVDILLNQSPQTVRKIKSSLEKSVDKSKELIEESLKTLVDKEKLTKEDEKEAILQLLRLNYDKKIETTADKELALSIYENIITTEAAKELIDKTPETIKNIKDNLNDQILNSSILIEESIGTLE